MLQKKMFQIIFKCFSMRKSDGSDEYDAEYEEEYKNYLQRPVPYSEMISDLVWHGKI